MKVINSTLAKSNQNKEYYYNNNLDYINRVSILLILDKYF